MPTELRPALQRVVDDLLALPGSEIDIDQIAEAIGDLAVTPQEIGEIMRRLEGAGRAIADSPPADLHALLTDVIATGKLLRERGRRPSPQAIAQHLGVEESSVRSALLFAKTLSG